MSRITDYILEPKVVYTEGGFLVRVKVIDDYKYKKYIVSENLHYKTVQGTFFTLTDASSTKQASITELKGNTSQEGTPTPSSPVEVKTVSGDNNVLVRGKNLFDTWNSGSVNITTGEFTSTARNRSDFIPILPSTKYTLWREDTGFATYSIEYDRNHNYIGYNTITSANTTLTFTTNANAYYIVLYQYTAYAPTNKAQLEKGNQATTYQAYTGNSYRVDLRWKEYF